MFEQYEQLVRIAAVLIWLSLSVVVGRLAVRYQRSAAAWFVLALVFSPLAAWVFLIIADVPQSAVALAKQEERVRQHHPDGADVREIAMSETKCPQCGATVNPTTRDGLKSPEGEPWRLICDQCEATVEPNV